MRRAWQACLLLLVLTGTADAADRCTFGISGSTYTLLDDCVTDRPVTIPDGVTLDGAHHTILAVDPTGGSFRGGIIANEGASASVINTTIGTLALGTVCQSGADRLRGIYFDGASGVIRGNVIVDINKRGSSCQEGTAIEIRNTNFDAAAASVTIESNVIDAYQKGGVVVSGNVDLLARGNTVGASATQTSVVANAVQIGSRSHAVLEGNTIAGNSSDGDNAATAVLLVGCARDTVVRNNAIVGNADVGIYVIADGARVEGNRLTDTGSDGAFDVGILIHGKDNVVEGNTIRGYGTPYGGVTEAAPSGSLVASLE
jgi:hypothetical protein